MSLTHHLSRVRDHALCHRYRELEAELRALEAAVRILERDNRLFVPAHVTVTPLEGSMSNTYPLGVPIKFAAAVANGEGGALPGTPVTWSATSGTVSADPANPAVATLVNAPIGDVTVTATTENGVTGSDTVTVIDNVPATVSVTDSAA